MGFDKVETVVLYNESDVDIEYRLRIATDSQDSDKAMETVFEISPKEGRVEKKKNKEISITFRPDKERPYDIVVLLDMLGIGFDMLTLPVSGICEVPEVEIKPMDLLDFGIVHIREEVTKTITLRNTSNLLSTQFKINKQDEQSKAWGELTCDQQSGQIGPEQTVTLTVKLKAMRLQQIRLVKQKDITHEKEKIIILQQSTLLQQVKDLKSELSMTVLQLSRRIKMEMLWHQRQKKKMIEMLKILLILE